ncbi:MAG: ABC transporter ATP-binding protein [Alphaproteobacteria bacterium]|nr:ABC transporter ATP-binding protein [Alphaproteobacteria bacterium]
MAGLSHRYDGVQAVAAFDLAVRPGEVVCLLGPSGCGKSTVLRLAAGLEALQAGRVAVDGRTMAEPGREVPPEDRRIGLVFQDYALFPHLDARGNVAFGLGHLPEDRRRARTDALLARVGLGGRAEAFPHTLSGGEQQRVALARALAREPRAMLLDEPFSGLDIALRDRVRDDSLAVLKEAGTATLLVTHDPEEAMRMADRIALMRAGRLVQIGTPEALYRRPADRFVAGFFGELNVVSGKVVGGKVMTSLGAVVAAGLTEGAAAEVLIRPEAVVIDPKGAEARVLSARLMGAYSLANLVPAAGGSALVMRLAGSPPMAGSALRLGLDPAGTFVFPG